LMERLATSVSGLVDLYGSWVLWLLQI